MRISDWSSDVCSSDLYLAYAEDFDGDGKRDIWNNRGDVFASIANYLAKHGWTTAQTWGREVKVPASLQNRLGEFARQGQSGCRAIDQMTRDLPVAEWDKLGVRRDRKSTRLNSSP